MEKITEYLSEPLRFLLYVINRAHDNAEYYFGELLDPTPKYDYDNETVEDFCNRITVKQALRFCKFRMRLFEEHVIKDEYFNKNEFSKSEWRKILKLKKSDHEQMLGYHRVYQDMRIREIEERISKNDK